MKKFYIKDGKIHSHWSYELQNYHGIYALSEERALMTFERLEKFPPRTIAFVSAHWLAMELLEMQEVEKDFLCHQVGIALEGKSNWPLGPEGLMNALLREVWPEFCAMDSIGKAEVRNPRFTGRHEGPELRQIFLNRILARPDRQLCWLRSKE